MRRIAPLLLCVVLDVGALATATDPLTFWSSDLHDGVRVDLATLLARGLGHHIYVAGSKGARTPYPAVWQLPNVWRTRRPLAAVLQRNTGHSSPLSARDVRSVYTYYRDDPDVAGVDAFICAFPASLCQAFLPLGKAIVWLAAHRYAIGRCNTAAQWRHLNRQLQASASAAGAAAGHVVAAMSTYDANYINYYTGIAPLVLSSSSLWYVDGTSYRKFPCPEILVGPLQRRGWEGLRDMHAAAGGRYTFVPVKTQYRRYTPQQIANHPAVVLAPYAVMSYGITELYAMGIPMFVPDLPFLRELRLVRDRRLQDSFYCGKAALKSAPLRHANSTHHPYSPEDNSPPAFDYWVQFADYFVWPHITTFSSWPDLISKLDAANLTHTHALMMQENVRRRAALVQAWQRVAARIPRGAAVPRQFRADGSVPLTSP